MNNRNFLGVWIPKEVWLDEKLSLIEKVLLIEIQSLDNEHHCNASNKYFAEFCGVGESTVSRAVNNLIKLGYIELVHNDGRHRIIKMIRLINLTNQPNQNDKADKSKQYANNIDNNITNNNTTTIKEEAKSFDSSNPILGLSDNKESGTDSLYIQRPTVDEVRTYATIKGYGKSEFDYQYFIDYYEADDWKDKGGKPINWKQTLIKWLRNEKDKPKQKTYYKKKTNIPQKPDSDDSGWIRY